MFVVVALGFTHRSSHKAGRDEVIELITLIERLFIGDTCIMKISLLTANIFLFGYSAEAWHQHLPRAPTRVGRTATRLYETVSDPPQETMGLPEHLYLMEVSDTFQHANVTVEKVSSRPPIFVLRNFLSTEECKEIMDSVSVSDMEQGQTASNHGEEQRKNSHVAWIDNDDGSVVKDAAKRAHDIFLGHQQMFHATRGVEPLQVVRYDEGGEYVLHQDGKRRLLTVLYYLNGAGETWFPLAGGSSKDEICQLNRLTALKKCEPLEPGRDGVLVSCEGRGTAIQQGDAVAFYNYFTDTSCDWDALHAGLPVSSTKWIGNHFYRHVPFSAVSNESEQ